MNDQLVFHRFFPALPLRNVLRGVLMSVNLAAGDHWVLKQTGY